MPQKSLNLPQMLPGLLLFQQFFKNGGYIRQVFNFCLRSVEKRKEPFCSPRYPIFIFFKISVPADNKSEKTKIIFVPVGPISNSNYFL